MTPESVRTRKVLLKDVLRLDQDRVAVDPTESYAMVGVYSFGHGLFHKEPVAGSSTSYKFFYQLKADHVVLSQLFGWEGALALSSREFDGLYVSPQFPTFLCDANRLDRRFLGWMFRRPSFWADLGTRTKGMGDRRRTVSPDAFLCSIIPLPPLPEQRRIVARIEALAAKVEAARALRRQAVEEAGALFASATDAAFQPRPDWTVAKVGQFCEKPQYGYTESATNQPIGPRFLRITDIQNGQVNWKTVPFCDCPQPEKYLLRKNDILFARTGATTGKSFLVTDCPEAVFASYLIRLRVREMVTPEYLYWYFQSPSYWSQIVEEKKGTGQANVNGMKLANINVPIAPPDEQRRIVAYLDTLQAQVDAVKRQQAATSAALDALLPSILDRAFRGEL